MSRLSIAAAAAVVILGAPTAFAGPAFTGPGVDPSVRPGDDFYRYANGPWLSVTMLPAGLASYDTTAGLRIDTARRVRELIQAAAGPGARGAATRKVGDYYASRLDVAAIEARGLAPLRGDLAAIAAITDRGALSARLGSALYPDDGTNSATEGVFGAWVHQDFNRSDRNVPHIVQGGLGLPDRDDYLDPAKAWRRALYRAHVAAMLKLAGLSEPEVRAERVLALETAIAQTHLSADDTADVFKTDNPWRRTDFDIRAPGLDWAAYFDAAGLGRQTDFLVWQPKAVVGTSALVVAPPLAAWKDYLAFHLVEHYAAVLPRAFGDEDRALAGRLAGGPAPASDPADRALAATNAALGGAVGRLYAARYFPPKAKAEASAMVDNIRTAFRARIAGAAWMSPRTKEMARAKLASLQVGLGYPERWADYFGLSVVRGDAFGNLRRAEAFAWRQDLARLSQPLDPAEWPFSLVKPQMVGALINFSPNSLQFSAGLLQAPYFDPTGDAAANYGSAGAAIAHEISHSFDELGNVYDGQGRLVRWWTPEDLARYRAAAAPLAAQFDAYCPKPGLCVKGQQVLGEDIADLTGLVVAHDAYRLSLGGKPDAVKDGLTGDQRFFLAFARRWRRVQTDAALDRQIATDTHAPGEYRADTVRNLDAWTRAFDVRPGDRLYLKPEARVRIW
jgi:predicted metalloendopeptidase